MPVGLLLIMILIKIYYYVRKSVDISGHREGPLADRGVEIPVGKIIIEIRRVDKARFLSEGSVPEAGRIVGDQCGTCVQKLLHIIVRRGIDHMRIIVIAVEIPCESVESKKKYEFAAKSLGQSRNDTIDIELVYLRSCIVSECRSIENNLLFFRYVIELLYFSYDRVVLTEENIVARHTDLKDFFGGVVIEDFDIICRKARAARDKIRCRVHHMLHI